MPDPLIHTVKSATQHLTEYWTAVPPSLPLAGPAMMAGYTFLVKFPNPQFANALDHTYMTNGLFPLPLQAPP